MRDHDDHTFAVAKDGPNLAIKMRGRGGLRDRLARMYMAEMGRVRPSGRERRHGGDRRPGRGLPPAVHHYGVTYDAKANQVVLDLGD